MNWISIICFFFYFLFSFTDWINMGDVINKITFSQINGDFSIGWTLFKHSKCIREQCVQNIQTNTSFRIGSDQRQWWRMHNDWAKFNFSLIFYLNFYFCFFVFWITRVEKKLDLDGFSYRVACRLELPSSISASGDGANDLIAFDVKLAVVKFVVVVVVVDIFWSIFNWNV